MISSPFFTLDPVADGIFAAITVPGSGAMGNAAVVDLGDATLVFDTFYTPQAARDLRAAAEQLTGRPVRWVVNSHRHADHVLGNQEFEGATVLATHETRAGMATRTAAFLEQIHAYPDYPEQVAAEAAQEPDPAARRDGERYAGDLRALAAAAPTLRLRLPDITFADALHLHGSTRRAEVRCWGGGHTESDAVLWLPDDGVLLAGDLVQVKTHPMLHQGDPLQWTRMLEQIVALKPQRVVPGHGAVGRETDIVTMHTYLLHLHSLVANAIRQGEPVERVAAHPTLAPYAAWEQSSGLVASLRFLGEWVEQAQV